MNWVDKIIPIEHRFKIKQKLSLYEKILIKAIIILIINDRDI